MTLFSFFSGQCSSKSVCSYLEKISAAGTVMWVTPLVKSLEYSRPDKKTLVQLLSDDQPVVAGVFAHPGTFGNGLSTINPNNAVSFGDIFVTKVNSEGTCEWLITSNSTKGGAALRSMDINQNDQMYIVGEQRGESTFGYHSVLGSEAAEVAFVAGVQCAEVEVEDPTAEAGTTVVGTPVSSRMFFFPGLCATASSHAHVNL